MLITGKITRMFRKESTCKSKYISQERIRAHGRVMVLSVDKCSDSERIIEGKELPFEIKSRIIPVTIKKNAYVSIMGELDDLTKKKKIIVVDDIMIESPTAVKTIYEKKGIDIEEKRNDFWDKQENELFLATGLKNGYNKKLSEEIYNQDVSKIHEILEKSRVPYDVEVPFKVSIFFKRRSKKRGYESTSDMITSNPWLFAELEEFRPSDVKRFIADINPHLSKEIEIYANLTANVWSFTRMGYSYAPLNHLWYRMRKILDDANIPSNKQNYYLSRLASFKLEDLPHKSMGKLIPFSQFANEAYEYYLERYEKTNVKNPKLRARDARKGIYLVSAFHSEEKAAKNTVAYICKSNYLGIDLREAEGLGLDEYQEQAVKNALSHRLSIINGHAGSGKTHTIAKLIEILKKHGKSAVVLAPSAMAAAVAGEKAGTDNYATIHRIARILPDNEDLGEESEELNLEHEGVTIKEDVVIVDEMVMSTIGTYSHLLHAMSKNQCSHLILVGDTEQLPAIGPSGFFHQLVNKGNEMLGIPVTELKKQHRSSDKIYKFADLIRNGKFPKSLKEYNVEKRRLSELKQVAEEIKALGYTTKDTLFLCPTVHGKYGTKYNNIILRDVFNPDGEKIDGLPFYKGDPVIATKNDYADKSVSCGFLSKCRHPDRKQNIYNGTRGYIKGYDPETKTVYVTYNMLGKEFTVPYTFKELQYWITVGYSITVHKAQGSEAEYVVFINDKKSLTRNMLYTSATRRKDKLILLGNGFRKAVKNPEKEPLSKFIFRVKEVIENSKKQKTNTLRKENSNSNKENFNFVLE